MMKLKRSASIAMILIFFSGLSYAQEGRTEIELSGEGWSLWLDRAADWYHDELYLPPVNVSTLPINPPTVGWQALHNGDVDFKVVNVPGTVEEYYWGEIGGAEISGDPKTGGDYVGVSWWSNTFELDPELTEKRILLYFESVNLRAEVFINGELVGYDVIGNTPFEVDATDAVRFGENNRIDVRITDPVGNFTWNDNILMRWGDNYIPAVHGFGGITGRIFLQAHDDVRVSDIYVQNQPDPKRVNIFTTLRNYTGTSQSGSLSVVLHEYGNSDEVVWSETIPVNLTSEGDMPLGEGSLPVRGDVPVSSIDLPFSEQVFDISAYVPDAELWQLSGFGGEGADETALYEASVTFTSENIKDSDSQRFGFRWFNVGESDGERRFYLNDKRVFLLAGMSRGFWPKNGMFPTPEMAQRDMQTMFDLGMNTMVMHRAIGQPLIFENADKNGFFTYQESCGYRSIANPDDNIDGIDQQARELRREKLRRMAIRDRSSPSFTIYNLKCESRLPPDYDDIFNMELIHDLDPSRIKTYNSGRNLDIEYHERLAIDPIKLHLLPYDNTKYYYGWFDHHHWYRYSVYVDENYNNPGFFLRGKVDAPAIPQAADSLYNLDASEIIFWGEEGAGSTVVRLQKIKEELEHREPTGFRELEHLDWYNYYDNWLDDSGFRESYPDVDALTMSLGENLHYFHGRNIENVRLSNIGDGYVMNGWASAATRSDVVDMYRNPTADPSIINHYAQPLYIAVKLRRKVLPTGSRPVADFFIINEEDINGMHTLTVEYSGPDGEIVFSEEYEVDVTGGEIFGELLVENVNLPAIDRPGYYQVNASLSTGGSEIATGFDDVFAVDLDDVTDLSGSFAVIEDDDIVKNFLQQTTGITDIEFSQGAGNTDVIIVGNHEFENLEQDLIDNLFKRVRNGTKLIVLQNADHFAEKINSVLQNRPAIYQGGGLQDWGRDGRLFVSQSPYLDGLPQGEAMSWVYQTFYKTWPMGRNARVAGIDLHHWGSETIVALGHMHNMLGIISALSSVQVGEGSIILSTLTMPENLASEEASSVVAKRLFLNLLQH